MQGAQSWKVPASLPKHKPSPSKPEDPSPEDPKTLMPTERKSLWRTAEERRMSDLTRVLEWLERRQGKKKQASQKQKAKMEVAPKAKEKEDKKGKAPEKQRKDGHRVSFQEQPKEQSKGEEPGPRRKSSYGGEPKGRRMSLAAGSFLKEATRKPDLDIKDAIALESAQRATMFRRQSSVVDSMFQDSMFGGRRMTLLRDWGTKTPDSTYERKLKSLMEKGTEPKMESVKMLKPEEVLSCRYLRLSKNNIRTLVKLCKDAGLNVDIHPHMVESEIDSKKVFHQTPNVPL